VLRLSIGFKVSLVTGFAIRLRFRVHFGLKKFWYRWELDFPNFSRTVERELECDLLVSDSIYNLSGFLMSFDVIRLIGIEVGKGLRVVNGVFCFWVLELDY